MARRFVIPTYGMIEMFATKLKWIGRERNLYRSSRLALKTIGMCRIRVNCCVAGAYKWSLGLKMIMKKEMLQMEVRPMLLLDLFVVDWWIGAGVSVGMNLVLSSALRMVIKLNLNSGTVSGSPVSN